MKHRMKLKKKKKINLDLIMFGWLMDEYVIMMRQLEKLRYTLTNYCGFLRYGKHNIETSFSFWVCLGNFHATAFHM